MESRSNPTYTRRTVILLLVPALLVLAVDLLARFAVVDPYGPNALMHTLSAGEIARRVAVGLVFAVVAGIVLRRARTISHPAWPLFTFSVGIALGGTLAIFLELALPGPFVLPGGAPVPVALPEATGPAHGVFDWIAIGDVSFSPADFAVGLGIAGVVIAAASVLWSHRADGPLGASKRPLRAPASDAA
jgi:hypothetical protein